MFNLRKLPIFTVLTSLVILCMSAVHSVAAFKTVNMHGKSYVAVSSIKSEYKFTGYKLTGNAGVLTKRLSAKSKLILDLRAGSSYVKINTLKFVFSFPIVRSGGGLYISETDTMKVIDPILRPKHIATAKGFRTVIIDAGHGGKDAGAVNRLGTEAGYNLIVAKIVKKNLQAKGFKVIMTRENDVFLSLKQRVSLANRYKDAIFVSIHFNASSRTAAKGIETFTLSPVGVAHYGRRVKTSDYRTRQGNHQDSANIALASAVHSRMIVEFRKRYPGLLDRGIKRARYSVLTSIKHPAILVEGGFMSNPSEARWINNPQYQNTVAYTISEGIFNYRKALNSK